MNDLYIMFLNLGKHIQKVTSTAGEKVRKIAVKVPGTLYAFLGGRY